jgi:hypothetical protein
MAAPSVSLTIRDQGLGIVLPGAGNIHAKLGPSPLGLLNSIIPVTDPTAGQAALGKGGPLMEASALALAVGGQAAVRPGGIYCVPVNPSTYGSATAVTHTGPGTGTLTVAVKPSAQILVKVVTGGALATATVVFSIDGGKTYTATPTLTAATVMVPNASFVTLAFAGAGGTSFISGDIWTVATTGTCTLTSGTGVGTVSLSSACPVDAYSVIVTMLLGGALGTATFSYSMDGGNTVSGTILTPGSGIYVIPDVGLQITFAGSFTAGDTYSFTTTTASYTGTDLTNAWNALVGDSRQWFQAHIVGAASSVANAATLAATVETLCTTAASNYRFVRALLEVPSDTDANTLAAFNATVAPHVDACAGYHNTTSPLTGRIFSRNSAWSVAARTAAIPPAEDPGRVQSGPLLGVISIGRDEFKTPGLDDGRFTTLTTILGLSGFWVTNWRSLAQAGSDFSFGQYARVMDLHRRSLPAGPAQVPERVAAGEQRRHRHHQREGRPPHRDVHRGLHAQRPALVHDLGLTVTVDRTNNLLATQNLKSTARAVPLGYAKTITGDLGYTSSALAIRSRRRSPRQRTPHGHRLPRGQRRPLRRSSIELQLNTKKYIGVKQVKYKQSLEPGEVRGFSSAGARLHARPLQGRGLDPDLPRGVPGPRLGPADPRRRPARGELPRHRSPTRSCRH